MEILSRLMLGVLTVVSMFVASTGMARAESVAGSSAGSTTIPTTTSGAVSNPFVSSGSRAGVIDSGNSGSAATVYNLIPNNGSSLTIAPTLVYAPSWTTVVAPPQVLCPAVVEVNQALANNLWLDPSCHPMFVQSPPPVVTTPPVVTSPPAGGGSSTPPRRPESPLY